MLIGHFKYDYYSNELNYIEDNLLICIFCGVITGWLCW